MSTTDYKPRLEAALAKAAALKDEIAYLKLQIKQEKAQAKWTKESPSVRDLLRLFPSATVENDASTTYITVDLPVTDTTEIPFGWELREQRNLYPERLSSPIRSIYRLVHTPICLIITRQIY